MDKESKVIILPNTTSGSEFKIINLPNPTNLVITKSYLVHHDEDKTSQLYELNIIGGEDDETDNDNASAKYRGAKLKSKSENSIKSLIFEPGYVLQSPKIIISNKFNLSYLLISLFSNLNQQQSPQSSLPENLFNDNFKSLEDLKDQLLNNYRENTDNDWVLEIPDQLYHQSLANLCDIITENIDESFYRFDLIKILHWLNGKVVALQKYILTSNDEPNNSILTKLKLELNPSMSNNIIEDQLLNDLSLLYSIDYIFNSYLDNGVNNYLKQKLLEQFKYDFTRVLKYIDDLKIQQNLIENVLESNLKSTTNNTKKKPSTGTANKKVKRGAIDSFFKKTK
ncbi:ribonuclease H2 subunit, putative [Candida dubliniensis CD36]|uniref:Ribonuclease H2 subunit B n=1 Tax=Candida dubliniensis (strain CD36 / ATCC MYA-646 / CBS 7987 / NCPF 3949 / NRRL Y-17841) TaxID=573826 RepID=B9WCJ0_CANDC|nr:ribonuclease H2 subunit, putative [Candida dubliniensis CD36]CAX44112.1 ribonuclease H2 subunit, putative [Candida dubliniensis CD36]